MNWIESSPCSETTGELKSARSVGPGTYRTLSSPQWTSSFPIWRSSQLGSGLIPWTATGAAGMRAVG
jgi:hypothetical protein